MTATAAPRIIELAHASPGRLRLRLAWLRRDREGCTRLADRLAALPGIERVEVRPRTGSVLCQFDPQRTRGERIIASVRRETRVAMVRRAGAPTPAPAPRHRRPARVGRAVTEAVRRVDDEIFAATNGNLDLGSVAGLIFLGAGALEVAATRRLAMPSWFNLAWWSFRTFALFEADADEVADS